MMPRSQRLALWCLALLLSLSLYFKGRVPTPTGEGAAFSSFTGAGVTVRLAGKFVRPGVYRLPKGVTVDTAIKMTQAEDASAPSVRGSDSRELVAGDVVASEANPNGKSVITITKMDARERMLLKIPLHPDQLTEAEWDLLPGIGPALSRRIIIDRQQNGAFGTVEGLLRVPGLGPGKLAEIRRYF